MNSPFAQAEASFPMAEPRRPLACSILFADLVGASLRPDDEQVHDKQVLNARIAQALGDTPASARLALDAGDGVAICFALPAQAALRVALRLRRLLQDGAPPLAVRMGLHFGPVRVVPDVNERPNVVGDGINVARRSMDFAQANQLLAACSARHAPCRASSCRAWNRCCASASARSASWCCASRWRKGWTPKTWSKPWHGKSACARSATRSAARR